ncbi:MAG: 4Fe-4S dicluster domain-containing protein, partial [Desulfobacterales bacterium]
MSKYYIYQDTRRCIGCLSCESHCKMKNNLPIGPRLTQIITVGPKKVNNLPRTSWVFMPCFHCQDPWCVSACPTGAMQKRPKDGIVFVESELCVGCKACITACPWGTPQW